MTLCSSCRSDNDDVRFRQCSTCREKHATYMKAYYASHPMTPQQRKDSRERTPANRLRGATYRRRLRDQAIAAYGGRCACCGEDEFKFLALDHVNGGGTAERRSQGGSSMRFYARARREGWPNEFRLLCHNCNQAKGTYGTCPHEEFSVLTLRAI